ncbi:4Fe-4S binding protein [Thermogladius sp. 4427co]|uniref:4Fe-4S binding protein n=1 Tax=Thermogladius sp. 4427co TaxID=3450718 RepID=UPI003F7ACFFC
MSVLKPFKIVSVAVEEGRVTVRYPYEQPLLTEEFRGAVSIDASKCIGCGACVRACPPNALELIEFPDRVILRYFIGRCIFCWRCVDSCPVGAIRGTREFELASDRVEDLFKYVVHNRSNCQDCGSSYSTRRMTQYVVSNSPVSENYANTCPDCRKKRVLNALARGRGGV